MPLQSIRFMKRCWCGQPLSVCRKFMAQVQEAKDDNICQRCKKQVYWGDNVHCPHGNMPEIYWDSVKAEMDAEDLKDFHKMLARESKVKNRLAKQGLERFKFKSLLIEPMPGIGMERDGSISGYAYNICISALAGYAIAKRDGITFADFADVWQCENIIGIADTSDATKIQKIETWLSKRLDHSGATMQAALNLLAYMLRDGPKKTFADNAQRFIEFDLETAIARLHFEYTGAMQEIIDLVLTLKDDKELCTIVK